MKLNNKGGMGRLVMLLILIAALFFGWMYLKQLADSGKIDPEIARVIQDPVGVAKENVDAFNRSTQQRMDNLNGLG